MNSLKHICHKAAITALMALGINSTAIAGTVTCDSMYYQLQDLAVNHIRANEIWIEHYIDCAPSSDTLGGFVLSLVGKDGVDDRAVIAGYTDRRGWQYRFAERGPNIRFARPTPLIDVNGDGERDMVFTATNRNFPTEREYLVAFIRDGKRDNSKLIPQDRNLGIDSILPAPAGSAHPLILVDWRGLNIGGISIDKAPRSYRYYVWDASSDPPSYVDRTSKHISAFPIFAERSAFVEALPASGELPYESEEEYEDFLTNIIGYCLDQSNIGRGVEGFDKATSILERVRYKGSALQLNSPHTVIQGLGRAIPEAKREQQMRQSN